VATIHSTIISGAGASSALLPLLAGKTSILLVTDKNVGALEATQAIHRLLAAEGRVVEVIDTVPAEPSHHDVAQIVSQLDASQPQIVVGIGGERTGCSKTAVRTSAP
jgi:alcohol dehydrogenase class IV